MAKNYPDYNRGNRLAPDYTSNTKPSNTFPDFSVDKKSVKANKFDSNKYKVENHIYPSDLMGGDNNGVNPYGGNYVIFYINVSEESKLIKNKNLETVEELEPRVRGELVGKNYSTGAAILASGVADLAVGGVLGGLVASGIPGTSRIIQGVGAAAGISVLTGGKVAAVNEVVNGEDLEDKLKNSSNLGSFTRPQKRLKQTIALHIPNNLSVNYGVNWHEDGAFGLGAAMEVGAAAVNAFNNNIGEGTDNSPLEAIKEAAQNSSSVVAALSLRNTIFKSAISSGTGIAVNPKKEQIFENVDFRTFSFDYQFFPRDKKESQNIKNIIKQFKLHMHPEFKDAKNFLYIYPSEFDIKYYKDGEENLNIHRHTSSVLVDMNVNYTPNGNFNTFDDGTPTQINISLVFRELALLTKEKIEENY